MGGRLARGRGSTRAKLRRHPRAAITPPAAGQRRCQPRSNDAASLACPTVCALCVQITGLNNNAYQITRATLKTKNEGLESLVQFVKVRECDAVTGFAFCTHVRARCVPRRCWQSHAASRTQVCGALLLPLPCSLLQGDFMNLPFKPNSFDAA